MLKTGVIKAGIYDKRFSREIIFMSSDQFEQEGGILESEDIDIQPPRRFKVIMHNDDYTTMEFVVLVLIKIFGHNRQRANILMEDIHNKGKAVAGIYSFEIAETKIAQTEIMAKNEGYPLKCTMQEA
jgi:ATP-dependent Clp protease adaptor protein ClpS